MLCYFSEAMETILASHSHQIVSYFKTASTTLPIYELEYMRKKIALVQASVGAPIAAAMIDELSALGCKKYIVCGSCGVLEQDIVVGHVLLPELAIRDEGTSYHYVAPSREIQANARAMECMELVLTRHHVPFLRIKTWTTDSIYRETPAQIALRKKEGCLGVEMKASAYMAVALFREVVLGQLLYAGDSLGGDTWDSRQYHSRTEIRELLLRISLEACLEL